MHPTIVASALAYFQRNTAKPLMHFCLIRSSMAHFRLTHYRAIVKGKRNEYRNSCQRTCRICPSTAPSSWLTLLTSVHWVHYMFLVSGDRFVTRQGTTRYYINLL